MMSPAWKYSSQDLLYFAEMDIINSTNAGYRNMTTQGKLTVQKNTQPSTIKSIGDFISTQRNSLRTLLDLILERVSVYMFCKLRYCVCDESMHVPVGYMIK
jgi:hypothetical protein